MSLTPSLVLQIVPIYQPWLVYMLCQHICCVIIPCIQNLFTYQLAEVFLGRGVWKVFLGRDVWKGAFAHDLITRDQVMIS